MLFFNTENLEEKLQGRPIVQEFINIVTTVHTTLTSPKIKTFTFPELFAAYTELTGKTISDKLQRVVDHEANDMKHKMFPVNPNKVIYNELTPKMLDMNRAEFHEHTFDIHVVFSNQEQYIYSLSTPAPECLREYDPKPENDTRFVEKMPAEDMHCRVLNAGDGCIIAPDTIHFAGFAGPQTNEDEPVVKCVVKIDLRYSSLMGLNG